MITLLPKKLVSADVAMQKKRQIDEGLKLAQKVDVVKETLAIEEGKLDAFRKHTIATVQKEIDEKIRERDSLDTALQRRREELAELNKPIDAQWEVVRQKETDLDAKLADLIVHDAELKSGIALNIRRERENKEEEQRIAGERERATKDLIQAEDLKKEAKQIFNEARTKAAGIVAKAKEREEAVSIREIEAASLEQQNKKEAARLAKITKQQQDKDKEIADKYRTLQRTIKRLS